MRRRQSPDNTGHEGPSRRLKQRANRGGSSSRSQEDEPVADLPFGYLVQNNAAAHASFMRDYARRPICKPKSLDMAFFAGEEFNIVPLLMISHLGVLAEMACSYSEVMVRAFYHNLSYINGDLRSRVCGVDISMTADDWKLILGYDFDEGDTIEFDGDSNVALQGFNRNDAVNEIRRPGRHRPVFTVGQLTVDARILFYVMTHILFPRPHNHSRVLEVDIPIMWAILHGVRINWRHYICWMMYKAKQKDNAALPYAFLVQKILEHFRVPMHRENMTKLTTWNASFGQRLLEQCHIVKGENGVWHFMGGEEAVPDAGQAPPIVPPEVHHDDVDMEVDDDIVEPEGGFSLSDVMRQLSRMELKQRKMLKAQREMRQVQNERWMWIQQRLGGQQEAAGDDDQGAEEDEDEEED